MREARARSASTTAFVASKARPNAGKKWRPSRPMMRMAKEGSRAMFEIASFVAMTAEKMPRPHPMTRRSSTVALARHFALLRARGDVSCAPRNSAPNVSGTSTAARRAATTLTQKMAFLDVVSARQSFRSETNQGLVVLRRGVSIGWN